MASNSLTGPGRGPEPTSLHSSANGGSAGTGGRWLAVMGGTVLGVLGLRRSGWGGAMLVLGGAGLFAAGALGLWPLGGRTGGRTLRAPPDPGAWRSGGAASRRRSLTPERTQAVVTIASEPGTIFRFWRNFANVPKLMPQLERVDVLSATESRWIAQGRGMPGGKALNWRCMLDRIDEDWLLTWHTVGETALPHRASLMLSQAPGNRGTEVRLTLVYRVPAVDVAVLLGVTPQAQAEEALRRLKQRVETGELSTIDRQPRGHGSSGLGTSFREATE